MAQARTTGDGIRVVDWSGGGMLATRHPLGPDNWRLLGGIGKAAGFQGMSLLESPLTLSRFEELFGRLFSEGSFAGWEFAEDGHDTVVLRLKQPPSATAEYEQARQAARSLFANAGKGRGISRARAGAVKPQERTPAGKAGKDRMTVQSRGPVPEARRSVAAGGFETLVRAGEPASVVETRVLPGAEGERVVVRLRGHAAAAFVEAAARSGAWPRPNRGLSSGARISATTGIVTAGRPGARVPVGFEGVNGLRGLTPGTVASASEGIASSLFDGIAGQAPATVRAAAMGGAGEFARAGGAAGSTWKRSTAVSGRTTAGIVHVGHEPGVAGTVDERGETFSEAELHHPVLPVFTAFEGGRRRDAPAALAGRAVRRRMGLIDAVVAGTAPTPVWARTVLFRHGADAPAASPMTLRGFEAPEEQVLLALPGRPMTSGHETSTPSPRKARIGRDARAEGGPVLPRRLAGMPADLGVATGQAEPVKAGIQVARPVRRTTAQGAWTRQINPGGPIADASGQAKAILGSMAISPSLVGRLEGAPARTMHAGSDIRAPGAVPSSVVPERRVVFSVTGAVERPAAASERGGPEGILTIASVSRRPPAFESFETGVVSDAVDAPGGTFGAFTATARDAESVIMAGHGRPGPAGPTVVPERFVTTFDEVSGLPSGSEAVGAGTREPGEGLLFGVPTMRRPFAGVAGQAMAAFGPVRTPGTSPDMRLDEGTPEWERVLLALPAVPRANPPVYPERLARRPAETAARGAGSLAGARGQAIGAAVRNAMTSEPARLAARGLPEDQAASRTTARPREVIEAPPGSEVRVATWTARKTGAMVPIGRTAMGPVASGWQGPAGLSPESIVEGVGGGIAVPASTAFAGGLPIGRTTGLQAGMALPSHRSIAIALHASPTATAGDFGTLSVPGPSRAGAQRFFEMAPVRGGGMPPTFEDAGVLDAVRTLLSLAGPVRPPAEVRAFPERPALPGHRTPGIEAATAHGTPGVEAAAARATKAGGMFAAAPVLTGGVTPRAARRNGLAAPAGSAPREPAVVTPDLVTGAASLPPSVAAVVRALAGTPGEAILRRFGITHPAAAARLLASGGPTAGMMVSSLPAGMPDLTLIAREAAKALTQGRAAPAGTVFPERPAPGRMADARPSESANTSRGVMSAAWTPTRPVSTAANATFEEKVAAAASMAGLSDSPSLVRGLTRIGGGTGTLEWLAMVLGRMGGTTPAGDATVSGRGARGAKGAAGPAEWMADFEFERIFPVLAGAGRHGGGEGASQPVIRGAGKSLSLTRPSAAGSLTSAVLFQPVGAGGVLGKGSTGAYGAHERQPPRGIEDTGAYAGPMGWDAISEMVFPRLMTSPPGIERVYPERQRQAAGGGGIGHESPVRGRVPGVAGRGGTPVGPEIRAAGTARALSLPEAGDEMALLTAGRQAGAPVFGPTLTTRMIAEASGMTGARQAGRAGTVKDRAEGAFPVSAGPANPDRAASGVAGSPAGGMPAGDGFDELPLVQRTLARALSRLPATSAETLAIRIREMGPAAMLADDGAPLTVLHGRGQERPVSRTGMTEEAGAGDLIEMGGREAVKPSPVEAIPPGIPVAEDRMEWSIADRKLVSVGGMGTAAAGTAIAIPPATSGGGAAASEPSYKGAMPLVRPAIQAVAATAMLKERGGASSGQGSGAAGKSGPQDQQDERGIDLDSLAVEMAERIMRRLKREKERRGFHG